MKDVSFEVNVLFSEQKRLAQRIAVLEAKLDYMARAMAVKDGGIKQALASLQDVLEYLALLEPQKLDITVDVEHKGLGGIETVERAVCSLQEELQAQKDLTATLSQLVVEDVGAREAEMMKRVRNKKDLGE